MKRSIKHLPKRTQEELAVLQELILKYLSNVRMIILYGSYARGNYVLWDEVYDFGMPSYYQSDLDILVICDTGDAAKAEEQARTFVVSNYNKQMEGKRHPAPPQIIVESTHAINQYIRRKHYFFYEIVSEGILFYDDGTFKLGKPERLPYRELKQYTEEEYTECLLFGEGLLQFGQLAYTSGQYKLGAFQLHQACERFYKAFLLAYNYQRPKHHKIEVLDAMAKSRSRNFTNIFPTNTPEEREAYKKLCKAYIESRYNRLFTVTKEQYEYMLSRTEMLREVTTRECAARMEYYEEMARKEKEKGEK